MVFKQKIGQTMKKTLKEYRPEIENIIDYLKKENSIEKDNNLEIQQYNFER